MPANVSSTAGKLQATIETILDDRVCSSCGYNLKGLDATGVCPECGEPCAGGVSTLGPRDVDNSEFGQTSLAYLLPLGLALFTSAVSGLVLAWFMFVVSIWTPSVTETRVALAAATAWYLALLVLIRDRPHPARGLVQVTDDAPWTLKLFLVISQVAWIAFAACIYLELAGNQSIGVIKWTALCVGAVGLPALAWLLSSFALWARSLNLSNWLHAAAWLLAIGGGLSGAIHALWALNLAWARLLFLVEAVARFFWLAAFVATALFALQLTIDIRWAIINARERADSRRRIEERRRQYAAAQHPASADVPGHAVPPEVAARLQSSSAPPIEEQPMPRHLDDARLEPGQGVQPYPLEDTTPPDRA
ncbi:MAG: hypothetical protein JNK58_01380 [Phycisphaerae bacterium]|nr:hypothetical protein [Phycisphaerae bacterium]